MNKPHKFQKVFPQFATATQPALLCVISTQDQVMAEQIFRNILLLAVLPFFMWFLPIRSNLLIYKGTGLELLIHSWQLPVHLMKKWSKVVVWHTVQLLLTDCRVFLIFSKSNWTWRTWEIWVPKNKVWVNKTDQWGYITLRFI